MNKLFKFAQAKGKWHKFLSFDLGEGAKLYKNFAQKLLAVSLCAAMLLCTMPLRGGSHVSEAAEGEGTVLTITATGDDLSTATVTAAWTAFDLSSPPSVSPSWSVPVGASPHQDIVLVGTPGLTDRPPTGSLLAGRADAASPWVYDGSFDVGGGGVASRTFSLEPRCVGCWSLCSSLVIQGNGVQSSVFSVPSLPALFLARFSVPVSLGASAPWSPAVAVAHCTDCAVSLVAAAGAPVSVAGDDQDGWTITRTGPGETVLDLLVGDFKVGEVTVTEVAGVADPGADFLHDTVHVDGNPQRLRVYDPNGVLPADTTFKAEYVDGNHGDHNFFITHLDPATDVELQHFYNLTLTSAGHNLSKLDGPVELWFEAIGGIDAADSFISRVAEGADAKLTPTLYTDDDGVTWIKVLTDHFSPYALTDLLSADEKAALTQENSGPKNNVKTGDRAAQLAVAGLGMVLVLALGIMLRLITSKRKFEE